VKLEKKANTNVRYNYRLR